MSAEMVEIFLARMDCNLDKDFILLLLERGAAPCEGCYMNRNNCRGNKSVTDKEVMLPWEKAILDNRSQYSDGLIKKIEKDIWRRVAKWTVIGNGSFREIAETIGIDEDSVKACLKAKKEKINENK